MIRSNQKNITVATIGDANIDYISDTSDLNQQIITNLDGCLFNPIRSSIGGNGIFFSEAAKEAGFESSYLLSTLGSEDGTSNSPDLAAQKVISRVSKTGVHPLFSWDKNKETGKVIIFYRPNDKRLMIADRGANSSFVLNNLPSFESILATTNLLYISGYSLLYIEQRKAVHYLIDKFKNEGAFIFCDVVPHNIFNDVSFETYSSWTKQCDGIAIEAHTISGFFNLGQPPYSEETKNEMIQHLLNRYKFCLIRLNSKSDFLIANRDEKCEVLIPYTEKNASLRFTDRVIAHSLLSYLQNNQKLLPSIDWVEKIIQLLN